MLPDAASLAGFVACAACACSPVNQAYSQRRFDDALQQAREARAELDADVPAPFRGARTREEFKQYLQHVLQQWLLDARRRQQAAVAAYAQAAREASSGDEEVRVIFEALDMSERLSARFVEAALLARPSSFDAVPAAFDAFATNLRFEAWRGFEEDTARHCVERADARSVHTAEAERCRRDLTKGQSLHRYAAPAAPPLPPSGPLPPTHEIVRLPWEDTRHAAGCVLAGSLRPGPSRLYADATGDRLLGAFSEISEVRVERLELPTTSQGRYKLVLAFPVRGVFWLEGAARVFEVPRPLDLVQGHLWVEAGVAEPAQRAGADQAALWFASKGAGGEVQPSVPASLIDVPCEGLRFS